MSSALKVKIKQQADFSSPVVEGLLNLMVAADTIRTRLDRVFSAHGITQGQYNVLRILRGAGADGHPRCEIATRMIERAPDVTRIVDRLEQQGLVERDRCGEDRRRSLTRITNKGLELMERIEPDLQAVNGEIAEHLSPVEWLALIGICEKLYGKKTKAAQENAAPPKA